MAQGTRGRAQQTEHDPADGGGVEENYRTKTAEMTEGDIGLGTRNGKMAWINCDVDGWDMTLQIEYQEIKHGHVLQAPVVHNNARLSRCPLVYA